MAKTKGHRVYMMGAVRANLSCTSKLNELERGFSYATT